MIINCKLQLYSFCLSVFLKMLGTIWIWMVSYLLGINSWFWENAWDIDFTITCMSAYTKYFRKKNARHFAFEWCYTCLRSLIISKKICLKLCIWLVFDLHKFSHDFQNTLMPFKFWFFRKMLSTTHSTDVAEQTPLNNCMHFQIIVL